MEATTALQSGPAFAKPRRRWLRALFVFVTLTFSILCAAWLYYEYEARRAWHAAEAETDRLDPRWRLAELQADRPTYADEDNAALLIVAVGAKLDRARLFDTPAYEKAFEKLPPAALLNGQQIQLIRADFAKVPEMHEVASKLKKMPKGRFPVEYTDDYYSTPVNHQQQTRSVAAWLENDAYLLADQKKDNEALECCQTMLNVGRIPGSEWSLLAHMIQSHIQRRAVLTLERVLAQGGADEANLQALQARLELEAKESSWLRAMRGERAGTHHMFTNLRAGTLKNTDMLYDGKPNSIEHWVAQTFPSTALRYYPDTLRFYNEAVEIAKLPIHERTAKLDAWHAKARASTNPVLRRVTPALTSIHQYDCINQSLLRSAVVAVACERYRLRKNAWPATLDVLVKEKLLDAVPADPIDNQPMRHRKTKDGVVIYSIGNDSVDNNGTIDHSNWNKQGNDVGFRLWDAERRRQPALPRVVEPEEKEI